jgi:hypothetical protein
MNDIDDKQGSWWTSGPSAELIYLNHQQLYDIAHKVATD